MKNDNITLKPGRHGFHITFTDGFVLSCQYGVGNYCTNQAMPATTPAHGDLGETSTMEVALMQNGEFVVLEHDVAGWVPVGNLPQLMEAVVCHDWDRFCLLCGETGEPDLAKFPEKGLDYA